MFVIHYCLFIAALWSPDGKDSPLGYLICNVSLCFVTFPCGVLGQVWYLVVLIPDLCLLTFFTMYGTL